MQGRVAWRSWAVFFGLFCAVLLAQEAITALDPSAAPAIQAQEQPADDAPAASQGTQPKQTYLGWFFRALGITYSVAFLFISFTFVAVLVMNLLSIRRDAIAPRHLAEAFEANLNEKKFQEAFDLAKSDESMLGQMLAAGMQNLQAGYDKAVDAMAQVGEEENLKLEQRLSYISLIGTVSPMVGLLGTVHGMIYSFQEIAIGGSTPKPAKLAEGISTALVTTLVGLALAIPAIVAYNLLKNRLTRLTLEGGLHADNLMSRFETMGKK